MTRWKASAIHFAISISVALVTLTLMLALWYAPPFFSAAGGRQVLLIMLGVDVTLGPLITLVIFNTRKSRRSLRFDLAVIALLQLSALLYGVNVMLQGRPAFVVYSKGSFDLVLAKDIDPTDLARAQSPEFRSLSLTGPVYVYTRMPSDIQERNAVVMAAFSGRDLPLFPQYYQALAAHRSEIAADAKPIAELKRLNPQRASEIDLLLRKQAWQETDIGYLPLRSKFGDIAILTSKHDGKMLTSLDMQPW